MEIFQTISRSTYQFHICFPNCVVLWTTIPITLLKWLLIKMKGICYAERRNGSCGYFTCWSAYTHNKCVTETRLAGLRARSRHVNRVAVSPQMLGFPAYLQLALHRKTFKGNITFCQKTANTTSATTTFSWHFYLAFWRGTGSCSALHLNLICIFYNICMKKQKQMVKGQDWLD